MFVERILFEFEYFYSVSNVIMLFSNFLHEFKYFHALCQVFIVIKIFCLIAFHDPNLKGNCLTS